MTGVRSITLTAVQGIWESGITWLKGILKLGGDKERISQRKVDHNHMPQNIFGNEKMEERICMQQMFEYKYGFTIRKE
jgi:hypothetical protein